MCNRMLLAAILLGVGFWCIFLSFQTWVNIQRTMLYEMHQLNKDFYEYQDKSHLGLAIFYLVFAISNSAAPSKIGYIKEKILMVSCGVVHWQISLFFVSFLWGESDEIFYTINVLVGISAPLLWAAQATYLTSISTATTIQRNSIIFWSLLQLSLPTGNIIVFLILLNQNGEISVDTIYKIIGTFTGITFFGTFMLFFLPKPKLFEINIEDIDIQDELVSCPPQRTLRETYKFFFTTNIAWLWVLFFYAGMELAFRTGIYSSNIGFIKTFPQRKRMVAISGILVGIGEILAGFVFGILFLRYEWMDIFGCYPVIILGFIVHAASYLLIFLNFPNDVTFNSVDTSKMKYNCIFGWCQYSLVMALGCSFGLGFGDACFNTQIYTLLGKYYHKYGHHGTAFSIFKFLQCLGASTTFFYSSYIHLKSQLCILFIFGLVGTFDFYVVERRMNKKDRMLNTVRGSAQRVSRIRSR